MDAGIRACVRWASQERNSNVSTGRLVPERVVSVIEERFGDCHDPSTSGRKVRGPSVGMTNQEMKTQEHRPKPMLRISRGNLWLEIGGMRGYGCGWSGSSSKRV